MDDVDSSSNRASKRLKTEDSGDRLILARSDTADQVNEQEQTINKRCPYIDTIDRKALDFDFEKLCSVSLSKVNVYACLVCGKYFQGRGKSTHAFTHSVSEFHHIFLNLETLKFYCLPDNYEVQDPSFEDILYVLKPTFTRDDTERLDRIDKQVKAYDGKLYYPGIVGLNNLKYNDYCNVIFQALSHVRPLRDHFLLESNQVPAKAGDDRHGCLAQRFGELVRKLWNPRNFKAHVSPHEMLQAIVLTSKKKFEFTKQGDSIVFLAWFLNCLMGPKRDKNTVIKRVFEGKIRISSRYMVPNVDSTSDAEPTLVPAPDEAHDITSFLYLTLDLPTMPLFPKKDEKGKVIKPRISVYNLLSKFDGKSKHEHRTPRDFAIRRYKIVKLPKFLILFYKRFTKNTFFVEKNTHIVDFPMSNLNLTHLMTEESSQNPEQDQTYGYNLIANIVHDGEPDAGKGTYRAHILHRGSGKWFELQDLYVTEVQDTTLITLSESYIQIWERK